MNYSAPISHSRSIDYPRSWMTVAFLLLLAGAASGQPQPIDTQSSVMTVHVYRTGALSAFGHDHEISAHIMGGSVDIATHKVDLRVDAKALRVEDAGVSEKDRGEIQTTMLGPEVLDVARYPEIVFRSTSIESAGEGAWKILGNLILHGVSQPVTLDVLEKAGYYTGHVLLKQTVFGIKPVKAGGGAVKVKDEVRIDFDVRLAG